MSPRSLEITRDHSRSLEITRDHPISPEITRDHPRSGAVAFELLTEQEQDTALRTTVVYAAHPFKRFAGCGM